MQIPFHRPYIKEEEINAMADSIRNGWLTMGGRTFEFERLFREYIHSKESIAVNSCTAALHLTLICAGISEGDEVIVPTITHVSTAEIAGYLTAKAVFVDVEKETHLIDASKIEKKITKKTKAIIPVHYAGQPVDLEEINDIADRHGLHVIEDAAHAFPAKYGNKYIGSTHNTTCFSFYATKTLATGEGGMITTDNPDWARRMRLLRLHGTSRDAWERENAENFWEYDVIERGYKYNPTDISSALGIVQLKRTDELQKLRASIAARYNAAFAGNDSLIPYKIKDNRETSWHLYPLKLNTEAVLISRNRFINELKAQGITSSVHYIPLYRFTCFKHLGLSVKDFPGSEWVFERTFSLPIYPGMTSEEIDYVIDNVLDLTKKFKR